MNYFTPLHTVLLTGAGFTKPFRGYLASEMWSLIFNQPQIAKSEKVRMFLLGNMNYEEVYDTALSSVELDATEKQCLTDALVTAYDDLDQSIQSEPPAYRGQTSIMVHSFISRFAGLGGKERGFIFTLNQDLLLERFYSNADGLLQIPGLGHPDWFTLRLNSNPPSEVTLPEVQKLRSLREGFWAKGCGIQNFVYMKLHGSYKWKSCENKDAMVIGYNKAGSIAREPLLSWYLETFQKVVEVPQQRLVIIGYGFMDKHINDIIANASNTGLRLHVISPLQPRDFKNYLCVGPGFTAGGNAPPRGREIWEMLHGYHSVSVTDLVQGNTTALTVQGNSFFSQVDLA